MKFFLILICFLSVLMSCSGIETQSFRYSVDSKKFQGYLAYNQSETGKRPGIILVHEWWGNTDYIKQRADSLANQGYVALVVDLYGDGRTTEHPAKAKELSSDVFKNLDNAEKNLRKAIELLKANPRVNPNQIAAIGYCFGGGIVLEMAKRGLPFAGVASFHGMLSTPTIPKRGDVKAKVAVFHGGDDAMVSNQDLGKFRSQMRQANADLQIHIYPKAKHAFTNPQATELGKKHGLPLEYNEAADQKSWTELMDFLQKLFSS